MDSRSDKPIVHANTLVDKVLSACCGSIITSLVTTPFDVVKTRIQFQSLNLQNERSRLPVPFQAHCCLNAEFCRGPTNPLPYGYSQLSILNKEISKDLMKFNGTIDAFVKIFRFEGASKLWRGLSPTLLSAFPSTVIYYAGYDALKDWLNDTYIPPSSSLYWYTPMIAGGGARSLSATFISPLELLRTRLQSASQNQSTLDVLTSLKNMVKNEGIISLWRGLTPTLWRDIPFSAIYWMGYETIKTELIKKENVSDSPFTVSFLSGAMSGMIAAFITTPFDVIKTRKQVEVKQTFSSHGKTRSVGVLSTMRHIIANEGARELFRGLTPRVIKVAPACAIMVSSYEFGKRFFSERHYNTGMLIKSEATDDPPFDWPCCHVMNITFY